MSLIRWFKHKRLLVREASVMRRHVDGLSAELFRESIARAAAEGQLARDRDLLDEALYLMRGRDRGFKLNIRWNSMLLKLERRLGPGPHCFPGMLGSRDRLDTRTLHE